MQVSNALEMHKSYKVLGVRFFMKSIWVMLVAMLVLPSALAAEQHIPLLAVSVSEEGMKGNLADMSLEIRDGSGRVFLDTFPLTKFDTQISTRFAKEIACDYIDADCSAFDFIYTIRADTTLVGGPSAGAAATMLTIAVLEDISLDNSISLTGSINAGGLIGPVGGINHKIQAAADGDITTVLIPEGERYYTPDNDSDCSGNCSTIDLVKFGEERGVTVIEVGSIDDVYHVFMGKRKSDAYTELIVNPEYEKIMHGLADMLCNRTSLLTSNIPRVGNYSDERSKILNFTNKSAAAYAEYSYYSAASFCFGANVQAQQALLKSERFDKKKMYAKINDLGQQITEIDDGLESRKKTTITDLETYMIVKERVLESTESLNKTFSLAQQGDHSFGDLAYTLERVYSAESWSHFFGMPGKQFNLEEEELKSSCLNKIAEVEERHQYVTLFFPKSLAVEKGALDEAYADLAQKQYALCLFKAAKTKAEVDLVLSILGVQEKDMVKLLERKHTLIRTLIAKQYSKGVFPLLGYSYYEYSLSLKDSDIYSALLYAEYALELSNLDIYFENNGTHPSLIPKISGDMLIGMGIGAGAVIVIAFGLYAWHGKRALKRTPKRRRRKK